MRGELCGYAIERGPARWTVCGRAAWEPETAGPGCVGAMSEAALERNI